MIDHGIVAPVEEVYMLEARRQVARLLFRAAAMFGPIQLNGEERAYFRELLPEPDVLLPPAMTLSEVERRLSSVVPTPRVRRVTSHPARA